MSNDFQKNYQNCNDLALGSISQRIEQGLNEKTMCNSSYHIPENEFGTLSPKEQTLLQTRYKHLMNDLSIKKKSADLG